MNFKSSKPFFFASLFFAVLLLITVVIKLVFAWNPPTDIAPYSAGQTLYSDSNNNIGIATTTPGYPLTVAGVIYSSTGGFKFPDNTTQTTAASGSTPTGAVMFFNLASCPSGWTALAAAQGRYLIGLPSGGTLTGTAGTALSNLENRVVGLHSHTYTERPASQVNLASGETNVYVSGPSAAQTSDAGSVAGTNAPYLQLLVCQKN